MPATTRRSTRSTPARSRSRSPAKKTKKETVTSSPPPPTPPVETTNTNTNTNTNTDIYLHLTLAAVAVGMTQGGTPVSVAPFIFNYSLLNAYQKIIPHTTLTPKKVYGLSSFLAGCAAAAVMADSLPLKGPAVPLLCGYIGLMLSTPFYLSHITATKLELKSGLAFELLLPIFSTAVEYCHSRIFPYGSYGILPYCQYGNLPVMQLASIGGVWLIEFFVSYVSSCVVIVMKENSTASSTSSKGTLRRLVFVLAAVYAYGGMRLRFLSWEGAPNAVSTRVMKIAGVWVPNTMVIREELLRHHLGHIMDGKPGPGETDSDFEGPAWQAIVEKSLADYDSFVSRISTEAAAGANVVMLPELALTTFQGPGVTDERVSTEALLAKLAQAATDNNVFVGTGIGYNEPFKRVDNLSKFTETVLEKENGMMGYESNRFLLFSPRPVSKDVFDEVLNGAQSHPNVALDYRKQNPVPIIEGPFALPGNSTIPVADVDFFGDGETVKTASVICFDMEHPWHTQQLGKTSSIILNPSYDWPGLNPYHARIVAFRAIETGTSVFHHCLAGTTIAVDYLGNVQATGDYFSKNGNYGQASCVPLDPDTICNAPVHSAQLPLRGVRTVYGYVNDAVAWGSVVVALRMLLF